LFSLEEFTVCVDLVNRRSVLMAAAGVIGSSKFSTGGERTRAAGLAPLSSNHLEKQISETLRFAISAPQLSESGYSVPLSVSWARGDDLICQIEILALENPFPLLLRGRIGPMVAGRIAIRTRLARSQDVSAVATTISGKVLQQSAHADVISGGCGFDLPAPEVSP